MITEHAVALSVGLVTILGTACVGFVLYVLGSASRGKLNDSPAPGAPVAIHESRRDQATSVIAGVGIILTIVVALAASAVVFMVIGYAILRLLMV